MYYFTSSCFTEVIYQSIIFTVLPFWQVSLFNNLAHYNTMLTNAISDEDINHEALIHHY